MQTQVRHSRKKPRRFTTETVNFKPVEAEFSVKCRVHIQLIAIELETDAGAKLVEYQLLVSIVLLFLNVTTGEWNVIAAVLSLT